MRSFLASLPRTYFFYFFLPQSRRLIAPGARPIEKRSKDFDPKELAHRTEGSQSGRGLDRGWRWGCGGVGVSVLLLPYFLVPQKKVKPSQLWFWCGISAGDLSLLFML